MYFPSPSGRVRFPLLKAYFLSVAVRNTFTGGEGVFLQSALSVFPAEGLFVMISLQIGPWQKNLYIFLILTPNEVIPKPTSSFRRARWYHFDPGLTM